ncbi:MAG: GGDEF domain-containing phosphodiesterase [Actinomycetota bacterium]|nr:GGDEF domain-containing phosphodiesterase [Actinomycetota bacterium]
MVSARLSEQAEVKNRLFPKTRSWFALGAPLELMSPLSIARILFVLLALVWLSAAVAWRRPTLPGGLGLGVGGALAGLWGGLLFARRLSARATAALGALAVVGVAGLVAVCGGPGKDLAVGALFGPVAIFCALFLRPRVALGLHVVAGVLLTAALVPLTGASTAVATGGLWFVAAGAVVLVVVLLSRSALRRASRDVDTGLPNGLGLAQAVRAQVGWHRYVVASVLLEGIADAREALGYGVGTELLRRAVEDLGQVLPADAVIGRVLADELVIVRPLDPAPAAGGTDLAEARDLARTAAQAIGAGRYLADGVEVSLRPHVGLAIAPEDGGHIEELIRRASLSAPRAATNGLAFVRWDGSTKALTGEDLELLAGLRLAPERGELSLVYQPQIAARSGRTVSVEALLRWDRPGHGLVPPDRFIVLAERTGLIDRLTEWVVAEALDAQVRWRGLGRALPVSVNLSARSLTKPELASWILDELGRRDLPASALSVEVTETAAASDLAQAVKLLRPLYERGVRISIDDFGVGYTSLSVLPELPLNELKVDKHFVLAVTESPAAAAIVRTVRELTLRLGLDSVAEGVENAAIAALVSEIGYDLLQGYHFARPLSEEQLAEHLAREVFPEIDVAIGS